MELTDKQREQIRLQIAHHQHKRYETNIVLTNGHVLNDFIVYPKTLRPDRPEAMTAVYLARWLFFNNGIYHHQEVLDMGCGSGIQGVVMGLYGARKVTFSDIDPKAVVNTSENIERFHLGDISEVLEGNLFEKIRKEDGKFGVIVFNHPFFSFGRMEDLLAGTAMIGDRTMVNDGTLLRRFLSEAHSYLNESGSIIMPYYHKAGQTNDPGIQAPKHGYEVKERLRFIVKTGLQRGPISIYELRRENNL